MIPVIEIQNEVMKATYSLHCCRKKCKSQELEIVKLRKDNESLRKALQELYTDLIPQKDQRCADCSTDKGIDDILCNIAEARRKSNRPPPAALLHALLYQPCCSSNFTLETYSGREKKRRKIKERGDPNFTLHSLVQGILASSQCQCRM